jgi:glucosamine 6-phosphate synthetase-like amidotransferase/phosphosugar isomerase protein
MSSDIIAILDENGEEVYLRPEDRPVPKKGDEAKKVQSQTHAVVVKKRILANNQKELERMEKNYEEKLLKMVELQQRLEDEQKHLDNQLAIKKEREERKRKEQVSVSHSTQHFAFA